MQVSPSLKTLKTNPYVKLSQSDIDSVNKFLEITSCPVKRVSSTQDNRKSGPCPKRFKKLKKREILNKTAMNLNSNKRCFICRSPTLSSGDENNKLDRFGVYSKVVQQLEFNHGLPNAEYMDKRLQFCCQNCFKAVHQLSNCHKELQAIKAQINQIVERIRIAIRKKSNVQLDDITQGSLTSGYSNCASKPTGKELGQGSNSIDEELLSNVNDKDEWRELTLNSSTEGFIGIVKEEVEYVEEDVDFDFDPPPSPNQFNQNNYTEQASSDTRSSRRSKAKANILITGAVSVHHSNDDLDQQNSTLESNAYETENSQDGVEEEEPISGCDDKDSSSEDNGDKDPESSHKTSKKRLRPPEKKKNGHFACDMCSIVFSYKPTLTRHKKEVHEKIKSFFCPICGHGFFRRNDLERHAQRHNEDKPFNCGVCGKSFAVERTLQAHIFRKCSNLERKSKHPDDQSEESSSSIKKPVESNCSVCGLILPAPDALKEHMKEQHVETLNARKEKIRFSYLNSKTKRMFKCGKCHKSFTKESFLAFHLLKCNGNANDEESSERFPHEIEIDPTTAVICHICGMSKPTVYTLNDHIKRVHGDKPYKCDKEDCDKRFATRHDQKRHMKVHDESRPPPASKKDFGNGPFKCHLCEKTFTHTGTRGRHIKDVHLRYRPHKCTIEGCKFESSRKSDLERHILRHEKNKSRCLYRKKKDEDSKETCDGNNVFNETQNVSNFSTVFTLDSQLFSNSNEENAQNITGPSFTIL